jgi:hypothetical protein
VGVTAKESEDHHNQVLAKQAMDTNAYHIQHDERETKSLGFKVCGRG